ncbi:uncharacterized protein LOC124435919 [Xenia sp. Carnegie-2017]|uniref:uncharacterized protein LOC124435919 n=1 Tax=Xenia sp. Carnegie-2017 TaxID=2897299 RepID=UPI001F037E7B|nr:uncharacterized protein LOC124435919 [Xenia sp. Carnegie-2017]
MCLDRLGWDCELHGNLREQWNVLLSELKFLNDVRVPRCYYLLQPKYFTTQVHGFSDASESAIGAVVYVRTVYENGTIDVKLIASKTKVAPVKKQTIPRLELVAATVLAKLVESLLKALKWSLEVFYWVDSMTALHWIRNDRAWKPFVQHRVNKIRSISLTESWNFCPGSLNPADLPSRGISGQLLSNSSSWFNGPKFLARGEEEWPKRPVGNLSQSDEVLREIVKEHPNVVRSLVSNEIEQRAMPDLNKAIDITRYSSMKKLLRTTAYVMRFINMLKKMPRCERTTNKLTTSEELSSDEIRKAQLLWIRSIQQLSFEKEILFLLSKNVNSSIPIYVKQFGLFLDGDHVLRCRGRLKNSSLNLESKNPVLLPKESRFVELLICEVHHNVKHSGIRDTLTTIREHFWIIRGREAVKKIVRKCVVCRKAEGLPYGGTPPPDLPVSRVSDDPPFTNVGLDFAGPLFVRESCERNNLSDNPTKVYILLFTCASTRAIHLELTPSLSVPAFLRAFRRYASRRALPALLISDNAKTFRAACLEIRKLCRSEEVLRYLANHQITWQFIVEKAPWWEASGNV